MTAYDYPLLGLFWTFLWFYFVATWLVIMFHVILDIFRRDDSGVLKAGWLFIVFILPIFGVLAYVIARGHQPAGANAVADAAPATA
jgi:hypothetical protein